MKFKEIPIGTEEVDWYFDYKVNALNLKTFIYENTSGFDETEHCSIYLADYKELIDVEENDISIILLNALKTKNVVFALYSITSNILIGYVTNK